MSSYQSILLETSARVTTLTLNRPEALNALTFDMMREVQAALGQIEADREVRALIITGAGRGFCSGQDLRSRAAPDADLVRVYMETFYQPIARIRSCRVPVIMAVNGVAAGGGCSLALAGDIVVASRSARFIQVFSRIGLIPDLGSTYLLPRAVGRARALRMMLTNEPVPAETALSWGMIAECVEPDELIPAARRIAQSLAAGPTLALAATRALVDEGEGRSFEAQFRRELAVQQGMRASHDAVEGVAAFIEKRPAVFRGD